MRRESDGSARVSVDAPGCTSLALATMLIECATSGRLVLEAALLRHQWSPAPSPPCRHGRVAFAYLMMMLLLMMTTHANPMRLASIAPLHAVHHPERHPSAAASVGRSEPDGGAGPLG